MSDFHVLRASGDLSTVTVAVHTTTPSFPGGENLAGRTVKQCLAEDPSHVETSTVPWIAVSEQDLLTGHDLVETVISVPTHRDKSTSDQRAQINRIVQAEQARVQGALLRQYFGWGFDGTVT